MAVVGLNDLQRSKSFLTFCILRRKSGRTGNGSCRPICATINFRTGRCATINFRARQMVIPINSLSPAATGRVTMNVLEEPLLTEEEAAAILHVAPKTLTAWRCKGIGPKYVKYGRLVSYRPSHIREHVNKHVIEPSRKATAA